MYSTRNLDFPPPRPFSVETTRERAEEEGRNEATNTLTDVMGDILARHLEFDIARDLATPETFKAFLHRARTEVLGSAPVPADFFPELLTINDATNMLGHDSSHLMRIVQQTEQGNANLQEDILIAEYEFNAERKTYYLTELPNGNLAVLQTRERLVVPASLFMALEENEANFMLFVYLGIRDQLAKNMTVGSIEWKAISDKLDEFARENQFDPSVQHPEMIDVRLNVNYTPLFYRLANIPIELENFVRVTNYHLNLNEVMVESSQLVQDFLRVATPGHLKLLAQRTDFAEGKVKVTKNTYTNGDTAEDKGGLAKVVKAFNNLLHQSPEKTELTTNELVEIVAQQAILARAILVTMLDYKTRRSFLYAIRVHFMGHSGIDEPVEGVLAEIEHRTRTNY